MRKTIATITCLTALLLSYGQTSSTADNNDLSKTTPKDTLIAGNYILNFESVCSFQSNNFYNNFYALNDNDIKNTFGNYFTKNDGDLILKLANGKTLKYTDVISNDESVQTENGVRFEFKYYFDNIDYYLIDAYLWEGGYSLLVNRKNGISKAITGLPYISKNHKKIMCINKDLEAEYTVNGLEFYNVLNDSLQTEFEKPIEGWGPSDMSWINENQFLLKTERRDNETGEDITEFKRVTIKMKTNQ